MECKPTPQKLHKYNEFYRVEMDPDSIYYNPLVEDAQTAVNDFQEYTLFEDCKFTFVQLELKTLNMTIRRCILHGAYTSYDKNRKPSNCHLGRTFRHAVGLE